MKVFTILALVFVASGLKVEESNVLPEADCQNVQLGACKANNDNELVEEDANAEWHHKNSRNKGGLNKFQRRLKKNLNKPKNQANPWKAFAPKKRRN